MKALFAFMAWGLAAALCFGAHPKLARDLETTSSGTVDVIVQFETAADQLRLEKVRNSGGVHKMTLHSIKGAALLLMARTEVLRRRSQCVRRRRRLSGPGSGLRDNPGAGLL